MWTRPRDDKEHAVTIVADLRLPSDHSSHHVEHPAAVPLEANMPKLSQYEIEREKNIARNQEVLEKLNIVGNLFPSKEVRRPKKPAAPKKRKAEVDENDDTSVGTSPSKIARTETGDEPLSGARRSARNAGKRVDYKAEQIRTLPGPVSSRNGSNRPGNAGPLGTGASSRKMHAFPSQAIRSGTDTYIH